MWTSSRAVSGEHLPPSHKRPSRRPWGSSSSTTRTHPSAPPWRRARTACAESRTTTWQQRVRAFCISFFARSFVFLFVVCWFFIVIRFYAFFNEDKVMSRQLHVVRYKPMYIGWPVQASFPRVAECFNTRVSCEANNKSRCVFMRYQQGFSCKFIRIYTPRNQSKQICMIKTSSHDLNHL